MGGGAVDEDERVDFDLIVALPTEATAATCFLELDLFGIAIPGQACAEVIGGIEQPCITGFGREQDQRTDGYETAVALGGTVLNVIDLLQHLCDRLVPCWLPPLSS